MKKYYLSILCLCLYFFLSAQENSNLNYSTKDESNIENLFNKWENAYGDEFVRLSNRLSEKFVEQELTDSLRIFRLSDEKLINAWVLYCYAEYQYSQNEFSDALEVGLRALSFCEQLDDKLLHSDCLNIVGICYQRLGDFGHALLMLERCYEIDSQNEDKERISSDLNNLAALYMSIDQLDVAREYILKAISIERELRSRKQLAIRLGLASDIYMRLDMVDSAMVFIQEAYSIDNGDNRYNKAAIRLSQMAAIYKKQEKYDLVENCLKEAIPEFIKSGNYISHAISLNLLGDICYEKGQISTAISNYKKALEITEDTGSLNVNKSSYYGLWRCTRETNPQASLTYLERFHELQTEIFKQETERSLANFRVKYETAQKEKELLIYQNQVQKNKRMLVVISLFAVFLALIIILLILIFVIHYRQTRILEKNKDVKTKLLEIIPQISNNDVGKQISNIVQEVETNEKPLLTARELEILRCCAEGLQAKEIAAKLNISTRTVDAHKANIFKKLEINTTLEMVMYAKDHGII